MRGDYPQSLQHPASVDLQRYAPNPVQLCRIVGTDYPGNGPISGVERVTLRVPDSRIWVSMHVVFEADNQTPLVVPPSWNDSNVWSCLRAYSPQGMLPVANVRGTRLLPEAWPLDAGLVGHLDEGITTADELMATLYINALNIERSGRIVAYAKVESNLRLTHDEWQRIRSETVLRKIDGPETIWAGWGS